MTRSTIDKMIQSSDRIVFGRSTTGAGGKILVEDDLNMSARSADTI